MKDYEKVLLALKLLRESNVEYALEFKNDNDEEVKCCRYGSCNDMLNFIHSVVHCTVEPIVKENAATKEALLEIFSKISKDAIEKAYAKKYAGKSYC